MAPISSYNDIITRVGGNYYACEPIYGETQATTGIFVTNTGPMCRLFDTAALPNPLPSGVSSYVPTFIQARVEAAVGNAVLFTQAVNLGSLNIGTNTFTDGSAMPTVTELGNSNATWGPVLVEITTGLNATPGNFTITYVDQDGNAAETTSNIAMPTTNNGIRTVGWVTLNSTDVGVRDITAAAQNAGTTPSGVIRFWGVRPIGQSFTTTSIGVLMSENLLSSGFIWSELGAGEQPIGFSVINGTTQTAKAASGAIYYIGASS